MAQRDKPKRSSENEKPSVSQTLAAFARAEATRAAQRGELAQALDWLQRADRSAPDILLLEHELIYRYGSELAGLGDYATAARQFGRAAAYPGPFATLARERIRLLRNHAASTRDVAQLRERFGRECADCEGSDLYTIATCRHQATPVPMATKLDATMLSPPVTLVFAAAAYRSGWDPERGNPLSVLMRLEKERIAPPAARLLGTLLAAYVANHTPLLKVVDAAVPVPTSLAREEKRGGGIPHLLCATLRDQLALPMYETIVQVEEHLDHTQARGRDRQNSLRAVWRVNTAGPLANRAVLLVDDILTTGLTMSTAAEMLREHGVQRVYGVALLHTERSR